MAELDVHQRPLRNLRLSVTDRCNLRCAYCMPEQHYNWLPRADILRFEEISSLVDAFVALGVDKLRLTGGEPLLRQGLDVLVGMLCAKPGLRDVAITTNGVLLREHHAALFAAGLGRVTVSLDTLIPARFERLARRNDLHRSLDGIASVAGTPGLKIDTVVMRGVNDDELGALLRYGATVGAEVRFIEYMDVGGATSWDANQVVPRAEILERIAREFGHVEEVRSDASAPADRFRAGGGEVFGVISSTTQPFCGSCDRSRLTADGMWYLCLYAKLGIDLRGALRAGESESEIAARIRGTWSGRTDRGAEERLAQLERGVWVAAENLRDDPHLEMHTRGG